MAAAEQWEPDDARVSCPVLRGLRLASALSSVAWDGDRGKAKARQLRIESCVVSGNSHCEA